jgi:sorbitol-specific phosphotransferase system component IIBC
MGLVAMTLDDPYEASLMQVVKVQESVTGMQKSDIVLMLTKTDVETEEHMIPRELSLAQQKKMAEIMGSYHALCTEGIGSFQDIQRDFNQLMSDLSNEETVWVVCDCRGTVNIGC